jgi:hypothetical protein
LRVDRIEAGVVEYDRLRRRARAIRGRTARRRGRLAAAAREERQDSRKKHVLDHPITCFTFESTFDSISALEWHSTP